MIHGPKRLTADRDVIVQMTSAWLMLSFKLEITYGLALSPATNGYMLSKNIYMSSTLTTNTQVTEGASTLAGV